MKTKTRESAKSRTKTIAKVCAEFNNQYKFCTKTKRHWKSMTPAERAKYEREKREYLAKLCFKNNIYYNHVKLILGL